MLEPLLWLVDPELMFLLVTYLGTFFLSAYTILLIFSRVGLFEYGFRSDRMNSIRKEGSSVMGLYEEWLCDSLESKGYWL